MTSPAKGSAAGVPSLVSVIMPVYNGCAFLPETFEAVDRQTYRRIERIAVDDGSTDGSVEAIRRHGGWTLRVVDRGGSNRARVEGLAAATGEFIAFLDQDDLWHPDHIACCVAALQRQSEAPAVVARRQRFQQPRELRLSADGVATVQYDPWQTFPMQVIDTPSMVVARRSALDAIGGWPETGGAAADCLAWWRLSVLGPFAVTPSRTVGVRESPGSMSVVDRRAPLDCLENMRRVALDAVGSLSVAERDFRATRASDLLDALARTVAAIDDQQDVTPAALHLEAVLAPQSDAMVLLAIRLLGWLYGPRLQQAHASPQAPLLEVMLVQWPAQAVRTRREMRRLAATATHTSDLLAFLGSAPGCWSGWHCLVENLLARLARGCGRVGDPLDLRVVEPGHSIAFDRGRAARIAGGDASLHSTPREPLSLSDSLCLRVHDRDIYADFPHALYPLDLQGWNSRSLVFRRLMTEVRPRCVVELGTWKGGSALHMCDLAEELGLPSCVVICVDTWLGGTWHWQERLRADAHPGLACQHGFPQVYFQFLANVIKTGHTDRIVPFPNTTDVGAEYFQSIGWTDVDLLYVDAAHTFEAVYADIRNWWPLVRRGGTVFGDDFIPEYPGVEQAVTRFCREHGLPFEIDQEKWIIRKP